MIDCLRWVLEDIKEAIFFLPSNRLATLLLSKDALKGLVTWKSAPASYPSVYLVMCLSLSVVLQEYGGCNVIFNFLA